MSDKKNSISLALGTFDGLHLGHMAVINTAKKSEYPMYALIFDEHPLKALTGNAPPEIMHKKVFEKLCAEYGINKVNMNFEKIMHLTAEEFFYDILLKQLNVKELSCGENYTFGKGGTGNSEVLKELCDKNSIKLNIVPTVMYKGKAVSSTRIRKCLENGEITEANAMLGRAFSYIETVTDGEKRGRKLGFPTANQILPDGFVNLRHGVYATACFIDGKLCPAVTNYGVKPTFNGKTAVSETYIIDYKDNLYNELIEIHVLDFIRDEKKFPDADALIKEISVDCEKAMKIFHKYLV